MQGLVHCAALGVAFALWVAPPLVTAAQNPNESELKRCMTRIEFVEPMPALQPELVECLKTAGDRNPGAQFLDAQSMPQPRRLPDGRRYIVIGGVAAQRDVYAELKDYPDETAIAYVGEELRRLACKQGADAILRAGVTCGPCPDQDTVPCVFAHGSFIVWVSTQPNE